MLNGLPLRETTLQIGITHVTAYYWRHKVLSALAKESIGISNEQVCVLVTRDRNKTTLSKRLGSGRILMEQIDNTLTSHNDVEHIIRTEVRKNT